MELSPTSLCKERPAAVINRSFLEGSWEVFLSGALWEKELLRTWHTVLHSADGFVLFPLGHFATITLNFTDKGGETEVCLEGKGIPASEEERTKQGWQRYYFEGIKQTFGYGARLF